MRSMDGTSSILKPLESGIHKASAAHPERLGVLTEPWANRLKYFSRWYDLRGNYCRRGFR